jgi:hypothetical protein
MNIKHSAEALKGVGRIIRTVDIFGQLSSQHLRDLYLLANGPTSPQP